MYAFCKIFNFFWFMKKHCWKLETKVASPRDQWWYADTEFIHVSYYIYIYGSGNGYMNSPDDYHNGCQYDNFITIVMVMIICIMVLTQWGRVTHICVGKLTIIASDNGLSPGRRQAIIWTNAGISLIGSLGTNFSDILIGIQTFSFKKLHLRM